LVFVVDFNVSHNYGQLLFVDVDSGYPLRHRLLLAGAESVPEITLSRVSGIAAPTGGETTHHLFAYSLYHARSGSDSYTASASPLLNQSPRSEPSSIMPRRSETFMWFRGLQALAGSYPHRCKIQASHRTAENEDHPAKSLKESQHEQSRLHVGT
jgi:hypothetical protein